MTTPEQTTHENAETTPTRHEIDSILRGQHEDPFRILGLHDRGGRMVLNAFVPDATEVAVTDEAGKQIATLDRISPEGFFHAVIDAPEGQICLQAEMPQRHGPRMGDGSIPIPLAPSWANWTSTCLAKAGTRSFIAVSARIP